MSEAGTSAVQPMLVMDFEEFVNYVKENKDAFKNARMSPPSLLVKKRSTSMKSKAKADSSGVLKPKHQKTHSEEKNATLDSFLIKTPKGSLDRSRIPEDDMSVNTEAMVNSSAVSINSAENISPNVKEIKSENNGCVSPSKTVQLTKVPTSIEIDLTQSEPSPSSTPDKQ